MWQTKWAFRLGILSVLLLPFSVVGLRLGLWPFTISFLLIAAGVLIGIAAVILVLCFVFRAAMATQRTHLIVSAFLGISPALLIVILMASAGSKPPIHDISTDWQNPPMFSVLLEQRGDDSNPVVSKPESIALQEQHYPQIQPIKTALSVEQAASRAVEVAEALNWQVVSSNNGVIEATFTSFVFGFVDDVVIRISPVFGGGSTVDLRSVSRVGLGDMGANAARIAAFTEMFLNDE